MARTQDFTSAPKLADWTLAQPILHWAYAGAPARPGRGQYVLRYTRFWCVLEGQVECEGDTGEVSAGSGQWLLWPAGRLTQSFSPDARIVSLDFELTWPDGSSVFPVTSPQVFELADRPILLQAAHQLVHEAGRVPPEPGLPAWHLSWHRADAATFFALSAAFRRWLSLFALLLQDHGIEASRFFAGDGRLAQIAKVLENWPCDRPLELASVAARVGLSVSQARRLFRERFGCTPQAYFDARRQAMAERLLRHPGIQVKEVSFAVGFSHPQHFTRWFARRTGQSPRQYVAEHQ